MDILGLKKLPIVSDLKIQASIGMDALEKKNNEKIIKKKSLKDDQLKNTEHKKDIDKKSKKIKNKKNMTE